MSGGTLRIRLAEGDEYEMPEQEAFAAMQDLEKRGVKFAVSEVPAADSAHPDEAPRLASEDTPPPRAPDSVQVTPKPEGPGVWRRLADAYTDASNGTAAALNTATFGLSGRALEAIGGPSQRQMNEQSPYSTAIGSTGAAVFSPANKLAAPVQGARALANIGRAALANGVMGDRKSVV